MRDLTIIILPLLATALLFAVVELGLSAYTVSIFTRSISITEYDPNYGGLGYGGNDTFQETVHIHAPGQIAFLVFTSLWTILITVAALILPLLAARRHKLVLDGSGRHAGWIAPTTLALNVVTMIFWLAGFAALSALYGGYAPQGIPGALLAFAVLSWLVFLALMIFNLLTAFGSLKSNRLGYDTTLFNKSAPHRGTGTVTGTDTGAGFGAQVNGAHTEKTNATSTTSEMEGTHGHTSDTV